MGQSRPLFLYFRLLIKQLKENNCSKKLPTTGFKHGSSGIGSFHAVKCATSTALAINCCLAVESNDGKDKRFK